MVRHIAELRRRVEQTALNRVGRRKYTRELREELIVAVSRWVADGGTRVEFARRVGVDAGTLAHWTPRRRHALPVKVVDEAPTRTVSVSSPSGYRVEGVRLDEAAQLLRVLG